jgi:hypothetical protein
LAVDLGNGTAVTGTGELFSSSLVTVPRALCRRECCSQPTTIARAPWRRAASVNAVTGSSPETSLARDGYVEQRVRALQEQLVDHGSPELVTLLIGTQADRLLLGEESERGVGGRLGLLLVVRCDSDPLHH